MVTLYLRLGLLTLIFPLMGFAKPSEREFRQEILAHRHRVLENGALIAKNFADEIPALANLEPAERDALVRYYLSFHDERGNKNTAFYGGTGCGAGPGLGRINFESSPTRNS